MNRCPISYNLCGNALYNKQGLRLLSASLKSLAPLKYTAEELRTEAMLRAIKISIQGVQPKLSAVLNIKEGRFEVVDIKGRFILKPQHHIFPELPQNEDLTMRLASSVGIRVPLHGLVYSKDHSLTYFIKRFDRKGQKDKVPVEDFAQLSGSSRDTKYNYSMEKLVGLIDDYCTFPAIEKAKLFRLVLFNHLVGNEDMHLKNYSVITRDHIVKLSPAYDLLNSSIVLKNAKEEIALPVKGKKSKLNASVLIDYFGRERCGLTEKISEHIVDQIRKAISGWVQIIDSSFLSIEMKEKYIQLVQKRVNSLGWNESL